ncbi:hypothetical protein WJX74_006386 [Apatococcus lobatus]|uniref:Oxysterol-binding protein n=1 Tax=Apatococcus lobatus TaxID=904363 RepID=A0AAW1RH59_9CHLO
MASRLFKRPWTRSNDGSEATTASRPETPDDDDFHDAEEAVLHPDAHEEGGLAFNNRELLESQRSAIYELIRDMGMKFLTGHINLINMSLPVKMFEPRSYLEKLTDVWVYPALLTKAASCTDPVERMRWTVTWFVAGLQHVFQSWRKPFNPLLGETYQASQPDGSTVQMEQISHHPPISAFQITGPGYLFVGHSQPEVTFRANAIKTTAKGMRMLHFADGTSIDIVYPAYYMRGILSGTPRGEMVGTARFTDATHGLVCDVTFGKADGAAPSDRLLNRSDTCTATLCQLDRTNLASAQANSSASADASQERGWSKRLGGLTGRLTSLSLINRADNGLPEGSQVIGRGLGNWLSYFEWDHHRYWSIGESHATLWQPDPAALPSDCRFREDLVALRAGDVKQSQVLKEQLEVRQRQDAKLRKP